MNHSRYMIDERRSPYPIRRKVAPKKDFGMGRFEPAITLLPPDPYMMLSNPEIPRPVSPGVYRLLPPKSAKNKASSFVILGETINTPVQSRASSPSGRVSPFRGHGFKSPTTSRPSSRAASPTESSPVKVAAPIKPSLKKPLDSNTKKEPSKEKSTRFNHDIGLPPKSPKKTGKIQLAEFKPPSPKRLAPDNKVARTRQIYSELGKKNRTVNGTNMVVATNNNRSGKKPPVPPKKVGLKPILKNASGSSEKKAKDRSPVRPAETKKEEPKRGKTPEAKKDEPTGTNDVPKKLDNEPPKTTTTTANMTNKTETTNSSTCEKKREETEKKNDATVDAKPGEPESKEKLVPCFQPDKCYIAPPTMASPTPTVTPTISTPSPTPNTIAGSGKNSESLATTVTSSSLSSVSSVMSVSGSLARKHERLKSATNLPPSEPKPGETDAKLETVKVTMTTTEEVRVVEHVGSVTSLRSAAQDHTSGRSSLVTVRAASNGSLKSETKNDLPGDSISTTKLINVDPDVEVLSPNNLLNSPPRGRVPNMAWDEERIPNGDVPSNVERKGRLRRFLSAVWRLLSYLFCCRCSTCCTRIRCCDRLKCCDKIDCKKSNCCKKRGNPPAADPDRPPREGFWSKLKCCKSNCCSNKCKCSCLKSPCCSGLNCFKCCKSDNSCCKKIKCCEGSKCCKRKPKTTTSSSRNCAKMCCSCKNCCDKVKNCCLDCGEGINNCCRALFCLNLMCCQRCLKKCKCCHKLKCCQKGGCCSCCNPYVKKEARKRNNARLDKKTSHASSQSKQEKEKLDQALVEHTSMMKAAIPVLPTCLAVLCLILNMFLPGGGTLLSGLLCLCFGKPRFSVNDTPQNRVGSFCVNIVIAVAQLFTVIFCLVGWGWSIWWGVIMYKLSRKQKRLKLAEKNQQQDGGSSNVNQNHVDVEQG